MTFLSTEKAVALHEAATENLIDLYRFFSAHLDGAAIVDEPDLFAAATGIPDSMMNGIFRMHASGTRADRWIARMVDDFQGRKLPFQWCVGPSDSPSDLAERLTGAGLVLGFEMPGMAVEIDRMESAPSLGSFTIEEVRDHETMGTFVDTMITACNMPAGVAEPVLAAQKRIGYGSEKPLRDFAGYEAGRLVATTSVYMGAGVAGIYCVGTLPEARRQGYASALVSHALRIAGEHGYRYGILQASSMGKPVYERLGFRETGTYRSFSLPTDSPPSPE